MSLIQEIQISLVIVSLCTVSGGYLLYDFDNGLVGGDLKCRTSATISCKFAVNTSLITWTIAQTIEDSSPLAAQCFLLSCMVNPIFSPTYNFTYDESTGVTNVTIKTVTFEHANLEFRCDNGSKPKSFRPNVTVPPEQHLTEVSNDTMDDNIELRINTSCIYPTDSVNMTWYSKPINGTNRKQETESKRIYFPCTASSECILQNKSKHIISILLIPRNKDGQQRKRRSTGSVQERTFEVLVQHLSGSFTIEVGNYSVAVTEENENVVISDATGCFSETGCTIGVASGISVAIALLLVIIIICVVLRKRKSVDDYPDYPTNVRLISKTETSATFTWTPGPYPEGQHTFWLCCKSLLDKNSTWEEILVNGTTGTIIKLQPGCMYQCYVYAITGNRKSDNSECVEFTTFDKLLHYEITGLEPATDYEVFVYAENLFGKSKSTGVQKVSTEGLLPQPPAELIYYNKKETELKLFWKPVIYKQKQSFFLTYTSDKDQYSEVIPFDFYQEKVEHIVLNLSPGTVYEFSLSAFFGNFNTRNLSERCIIQMIKTKGLPEDPVDFQLVDDTLTETTAEFCWKPGKYRKYEQIFVISYWLKGDEENITNVTVNDTHQKSISHSVKKLQVGKQYGFCILAQNEIGKSNISETLFVQTKGLPDKPRNFRLVTDLLTETTASFMWESGNYRRYKQTFVISYCLEHDEKNTFREEVEDTTENHITHIVSGLKEGKQYEFQIRAKNTIGVSKYCKKLLVKTKGLPEEPKHFRLVDNLLTETSATFTWVPGVYRTYTQTFVILYYATNTATHQYKEHVDDTFESTITHTVSKLQEGTEYEFMVYSTNNFGDSKVTEKTSVETKGKPEKPCGLIALPNTPTSISVSWTPGVYRRDIQHFVIKYRRVTRSSKRKWRKHTHQETLTYQEVDSKQLHYEITGLRPASDYEVFVYAKNRFGKSKKTSVVNVSTEGLIPEPPAEFCCCNITENELTLSWKPMIYKQKQSFYVTYTSGTDQCTEVIQFDINMEKVEYHVSNLSSGSVYEFSLWAFFENLNERKLADRCVIQMITTKGLPDDPVNFHLVDDTLTETTAKFSWKPGTYRKYEQKFVISYWLKGDEEKTTHVTVNDAHQKTISHLVQNLKEGRHYAFSIVARNEIGNSNISETVFVQTKGLPDDPVDFQLVDATLTETTAEFRWKPGKYRKYEQIFVIFYWLNDDKKNITNVTVNDTHQQTISQSVKNLKEGKQYGFCIVAQNEIGKSNISQTVYVQTKGLPDEPRNFRCVDDLLTETTATFFWEQGRYRKYQQTFVISYCLEHEKQTVEKEVDDAIENYITYPVTGLKKGKQYEFEIWSKNRIGVSNRCRKLLVETKGKPENPSDLTATPNTPTSVLICWMPGQYCRDIQSFVISYGKANRSSEIEWKTLSYDENRLVASEIKPVQDMFTHDEVIGSERNLKTT